MFDKGFFNGLFDFNRDGKLDAFERAADFAAFQEMIISRIRTRLFSSLREILPAQELCRKYGHL